MKKKGSITSTLGSLDSYKKMMMDSETTYSGITVKSLYPGPYPVGPSTTTIPLIPYSPPPPPSYTGVSGAMSTPKPEPVRAMDLEEKLERIAVALEKIVDRFC